MVVNHEIFSNFSQDLFQAIDREDIRAITLFFDKINAIDIEEAHELISEIYDYYVIQFGLEVLESEECWKNLDHCRELYCSMLSLYGISVENSPIYNEYQGSCKILLCKKNKNRFLQKPLETEIPGSTILGGVEVLSGALVWILPFPGAKQLGGIMIADGVRRAFNGLEEMDKSNQAPRGRS